MFSTKDKSAISMTSCKPVFAIIVENSVDLDQMAPTVFSITDNPGIRMTVVVSLYLQKQWKTMWVLIRWLLIKPPDLDLQCIQEKIISGLACLYL